MSVTTKRARSVSAGHQVIFVAIIATVLVAAGAASAWLVARPTPPRDLAAPPTVNATIGLQAQEFADARTVTLTVDKGLARGVTANTAGTLTSYSCTAGDTWASGTSPVALNTTPLLALHTSVPLWRDLTYGDAGEDVRAIQAELVRLGYDLATDGWFGWHTWDAYRQALEKVGGKAERRTLPLATLLWLPAPETTITGCPLQVGDQVNAGDSVAERTGDLGSVAVRNLPGDLAPGARELVFAGVTAPVNDDGTVTDQNALAELAGTSTIRGYDPEGDQDLGGILQLAVPITVYSVPVGTVADPAGDAFVTSGGTRYPTDIVGSTLGRTLIAFGEGTTAPAQIDATPDQDAR